MNEHVTEWLGIYLDGELRGPQLHRVEDHLAECSTCRLELDELQNLSQMLAESASAERFTPTERFVSNLALRINAGSLNPAERPGGKTRIRATEMAWWLIPAGVLVAWFFVQSYLTVSTWVSTAVTAGAFGSLASVLQGGSSHSVWFTAVIILFGNGLPGHAGPFLNALDDISIFGSQITAQLVLRVGIGLLYWAWLVAWWKRRKQSISKSEDFNLLPHP